MRMSENALLPNGRSPEWAWRSLLGILENDVSNVTFNRLDPTFETHCI